MALFPWGQRNRRKLSSKLQKVHATFAPTHRGFVSPRESVSALWPTPARALRLRTHLWRARASRSRTGSLRFRATRQPEAHAKWAPGWAKINQKEPQIPRFLGCSQPCPLVSKLLVGLVGGFHFTPLEFRLLAGSRNSPAFFAFQTQASNASFFPLGHCEVNWQLEKGQKPLRQWPRDSSQLPQNALPATKASMQLKR